MVANVITTVPEADGGGVPPSCRANGQICVAVATLAGGVVRPGLLLAVLVGAVRLGELRAQAEEVEDGALTVE